MFRIWFHGGGKELQLLSHGAADRARGFLESFCRRTPGRSSKTKDRGGTHHKLAASSLVFVAPPQIAALDRGTVSLDEYELNETSPLTFAEHSVKSAKHPTDCDSFCLLGMKYDMREHITPSVAPLRPRP